MPSARPLYGYTDIASSATDDDLFSTIATITATIINTGNATGAEVVQLYVSLPSDMSDIPPTPKRQLRAFAKTKSLSPGESEVVSLELRRKDVSYWDVARQAFVVPTLSGEKNSEYAVGIGIGITVGASSRDARLTGMLVL